MFESYAELHAHSSYSFLDGAAHPAALLHRATELELTALALTDTTGLPGVVALAQAAREQQADGAQVPATIFGTELTLRDPADPAGAHRGPPPHPAGPPESHPAPTPTSLTDTHLPLLVGSPAGYAALSATLARAHLSLPSDPAPRHPRFCLAELAAAAHPDWLALTGTRHGPLRRALAAGRAAARTVIAELREVFGADNVAIELNLDAGPHDAALTCALGTLADEAGLRLVATTAARAAHPRDLPLVQALFATRERVNLSEVEASLPHRGAFLRSAAQMRQLHHRRPSAVQEAAALGADLAFDLALIAPQLPRFPVPAGHDEASWLRELTRQGARRRYGEHHHHPRAWQMLEHELTVICQLGFPGYFLIVHDIVEFCRRRGILAQGRGSAANSAVCFALGITAVDAVQHQLLFERFLSPGRSGPPDIDLDIESARREEVIQYVYQRYGRQQAALVANVVTYRARSALRDAAKALGHSPGQAEAWAKSCDRWRSVPDQSDEIPASVLDLARQYVDLPRHLGIHPGGMVLCDRPIIEVCPVHWATMPGRTVLQWDKDDCAEAGLVKFDLLGLGMLTALRLAFTSLAARGVHCPDRPDQPLTLHTLPSEDPAVYRLLCAAETVGVFQVESRAQMQTLPRLRPQNFYDIVVEVALIRPGPIQGNAVTPYIKRRLGREPVTYLHPKLRPALEKTLGVPLFQEQLMQIAMDCANFTPGQADELRKAMGAKRSLARMDRLRDQAINGMLANNIPRPVAEEIFALLRAFANFGFPESHSFSFAHLVYASAWLKVHHPEDFLAGLLAAQPLGFYSPASLVADFRRFGVRTARPCIQRSDVHARVEPHPPSAHPAPPLVTGLVNPHPELCVRLGLGDIRGLGQAAAQRIVEARQAGAFTSFADLAARVSLTTAQREALAGAGALRALGRSRRADIWAAGALADAYTGPAPAGQAYQPPLPGLEIGASAPPLPPLEVGEVLAADLTLTGVSPHLHPVGLRRAELAAVGVLRAAEIATAPAGRRIRVAGVVTHRQRPPTAGGVTFLSLEDETGIVNVVCSRGLWRRYRVLARTSKALVVRGILEANDGACNLLADQLVPLALACAPAARDFR